MNKIYKSVWCEATGTWVATSETARSKTKRGTARKLALVRAVLAGAALVGGVPAANAAGTAATTYFDATTLSPAGDRDATAAAPGTVAAGGGASAAGQQSVAIGNRAWAIGTGSTALGNAAQTNGLGAFAGGSAAWAYADYATAVGTLSTALGRERRPSALVPKLTAPTRSQSATARLPHRTTASRWEQTRPRRWLLPIWPRRVTHRLE